MKNSSENSRFQSLSSTKQNNFPFLNEAKFLFGPEINPDHIYIRCFESSTEYLKLREDKFDIFSIKNKLIDLMKSQPNLTNKVQIGEAKFDHSTIYTMITFNH